MAQTSSITLVNSNNIDNLIDYLVKNKIKHKIKFTSAKKIVTYLFKRHKYEAKGYLNPSIRKRDLHLIMKVKKHVESNNIQYNKYIPKIKYITNYVPDKVQSSKNYYEIDLNAAYWYFAHKNGFISDEIFKDGLNLKKFTKKARLMALGSLATVHNTLEFNGKTYGELTTEINPTSPIFFKCAYDTSLLIQKIQKLIGSDFLFFWVDAIFFKNEKNINKIINFVELNGLKAKIKPIYKVIKNAETLEIYEALNKKPKVFNFEKKKK